MRKTLICLFSGGIDSPVACALMGRKFDLILLHYDIGKYGGKTESVQEAVRRLRKVVTIKEFLLVPWESYLERVVQSGEPNFTCLLCKKGMLKGAEIICEKEEGVGILTGEAMGQKASQTLQNLIALSSGIKFPIFRPLLGMDKIEIIRLSKRFGIWSEAHAGDCIAVSPFPKTRATPEELSKKFEELGLKELAARLLDDLKRFTVKELDA